MSIPRNIQRYAQNKICIHYCVYILLHTNVGFFFFCPPFVDIQQHINILQPVPELHCKLESRKQFQGKASHGTQHVVLYIQLDCACKTVCMYACMSIHGHLAQICVDISAHAYMNYYINIQCWRGSSSKAVYYQDRRYRYIFLGGQSFQKISSSSWFATNIPI